MPTCAEKLNNFNHEALRFFLFFLRNLKTLFLNIEPRSFGCGLQGIFVRHIGSLLTVKWRYHLFSHKHCGY